MNSYLELTLPLNKDIEGTADWVSAWLIDFGFEGIVESDNELVAYILKNQFDENLWSELLQFLCKKQWVSSPNVLPVQVQNQNWNQVWEQHYFKPISIGTEVYVRGSFHEPGHNCNFEIVIDPKMAFGTGHHHTTQMMLKAMTKLYFPQSHVLDMGTGTGILAIYAALKGAQCVHAVDIDDNSVENAREHVVLNQVDSVVEVFKGDDRFLKDKKGIYDIVLANINLGVLLSDMHLYCEVLKPGGMILLSGFLDSDKQSICELFSNPPAIEQKQGEWMLLGFTR